MARSDTQILRSLGDDVVCIGSDGWPKLKSGNLGSIPDSLYGLGQPILALNDLILQMKLQLSLAIITIIIMMAIIIKYSISSQSNEIATINYPHFTAGKLRF